jgi:hypothetical protein
MRSAMSESGHIVTSGMNWALSSDTDMVNTLCVIYRWQLLTRNHKNRRTIPISLSVLLGAMISSSSRANSEVSSEPDHQNPRPELAEVEPWKFPGVSSRLQMSGQVRDGCLLITIAGNRCRGQLN